MKRMKASELAKELIENIAVHGDGEILINGTNHNVCGIMHSDAENVPDMNAEPWFEILTCND